jgi:Fur family ferric uptake transcriptional regulator
MGDKNTLDTKFIGRSTQQRQLILDIIEKSNKHFDVGEIYQRARQRSHSISMSTIYRNLQLFKEQGLAKEHHFDGVRKCYEKMPSSQHHHLICIGCGKVFEFTCSSASKIKTELYRDKGFKVTDVEVRFTGYCLECLSKQIKNSSN